MAKGKYHRWIEPDGLTLITGWARSGLTDEQIAHNMGIGSSTLYEWEKQFPEIVEALKKGKEVVDFEVENALFKRALGYKYDEVTVEDGEETKRVTKEVPPDTTAGIFWLKNRKPKEWRDRVDVQQASKVVDMSKFSTEEIKGMLDDDV